MGKMYRTQAQMLILQRMKELGISRQQMEKRIGSPSNAVVHMLSYGAGFNRWCMKVCNELGLDGEEMLRSHMMEKRGFGAIVIRKPESCMECPFLIISPHDTKIMHCSVRPRLKPRTDSRAERCPIKNIPERMGYDDSDVLMRGIAIGRNCILDALGVSEVDR